MLKRVIGPLVMGPACFLVGLLLLRFFSAILSAETMWFVLKLGLIGALSYLAWSLLKPHAYTVTPLLSRALAPLQQALASRTGVQSEPALAPDPSAASIQPALAQSPPRAAITYLPPPAASYTNSDAADFVPYVPKGYRSIVDSWAPEAPVVPPPERPGPTAPTTAAAGVEKSPDIYRRPSGFRAGVRDQVWETAIEPSTGQVRDAVTGRFMSGEKPWDMGHLPGHEFRRHAEDARERGITREEFLDEHNDPSKYRPEMPSSNRSHRGELLD